MKKWILILAAAAVVLLAACMVAGQPSAEPAAGQDTPEPQPTATLDPEDPLLQDAQSYAEAFGVSSEEAVRRMQVQQALGESGLPATLMQKEAGTFAGLWIQNEPAYRIVVAFTEGGEETIGPYLEGLSFADLVEVRTHRYTLAELREAQQQAMELLNELGIAASSGIDVQENRVTLTVGNPQLVQEDLKAAGMELPQQVRMQAIDPENLSDTLRGGVEMVEGPQGQTITFPKQPPAAAYMEAEVRGTLILDDNGCLRVESEWAEEAYLVVWHHDFALQVGEDDDITVLNGAGEVVARVGQPLREGGGYVEGGQVPHIPGLPIGACPGPYIILGSLPAMELQAIPDIFTHPFGLDDPASAGLLLSQSKPAPEEGAIRGPLTLENGCLRVEGYTVLWPPDVYPDEEARPVEIVYRVPGEEAQTVAVVGEEVTLAGSERQPADYRFFENKVDCPGPYWGVAVVAEEISPETSSALRRRPFAEQFPGK